MYTLAHAVSENRQWDRCPTRLRIGHIKLTHGHYKSREQPPTCEDCGEDTPVTKKCILTERLSLNKKKVSAQSGKNCFEDSISVLRNSEHVTSGIPIAGLTSKLFAELSGAT